MYGLAYISTLLQAADILTKPFTSVDKWNKAVYLIGHSLIKTSRPASPVVELGDCGTADDQRIEPEYDGVLIEWGFDPTSSLLGRADFARDKNKLLIRVTHGMDLNNVGTCRDTLKVAKSHHRAGRKLVMWLDLRFAGGPDNVLENKKDFCKLWATFVNLSTGLDAIGCKYVIVGPANHYAWKFDRVDKWCSSHKCHEVSNGQWKLRTTITDLSTSWSSVFPDFVVESMNTPRTLCVPAAVAVRTVAIEHPPDFYGAMSSPSKPVVSTEERRRRLETFRKALKDPECLAEAMALEAPAYFYDAYGSIREAYQYRVVEPSEEDDPEGKFLGRIKNGQWIGLRKEYPLASFPLLYEMWHRKFSFPEKYVRFFEQDEGETPSLLTEWTNIIKCYCLDIGMLGYGENAEKAIASTAQYDICHRVWQLSQGSQGYHELMPAATDLLDKVYTPALARIEHALQQRSYFIFGGDSSLALVTRDGGRAATRGTMEPSLRKEMTKDTRMDGCSVVMKWGRGLKDIVDGVERELGRVLRWRTGGRPLAPEGVDIVVQWAGNDVYGEYGYKGFSFHMRHQWVRIDDELHDRLSHWETKGRKAVSDAKDRLVALASRKGVSSITLVAGPHNGEFYGLPEVYDTEMDVHIEDLKSRGIRIVDPQSLICSTTRYDMFHMEATHDNVRMTTMWYFHLCSAILFERWLTRMTVELRANSRGVLFYNHYHLGIGLEGLDIPPTSDLMIPEETCQITFPPTEPPAQRFPEEEIVLSYPILSLEKLDELEGYSPTDYTAEVAGESEIISLADRIARNPDPDEEHVTVEAVDPGSVEHTTVLEMIDQVDSAMPTEEAERVEEAQGAQPYRFLEPDTNPAVVVEGDALSTIATTDIPTEVWDSGPMNVDYGDDDEVEVIPRGSGRPEAMWLTVDQLPDMSKETGFFRLTEYEAVSLSKKLSFHLRGFAKERNVRTVELDEELSADIEEIIRIIGRQWSGLSVKTILDVMTSRHIDKGRFELLAEALDQETAMGTGSNWKFTRIPRFPGSCCLSACP